MKKKNPIKIKLLDESDLILIKDELKTLLSIIDDDFIPPLSTRINTTQMELSSSDSKNIDFYFENIMNQKIIIAQKNNYLLGFMSFIDFYKENIPLGNVPCNYITTVGIFPNYRNNQIATKLYEFMINELIDLYSYPNIVTRTWSTNISHLNLLHKLGFKEIKNIMNHRGQNIDTVYYAYQKD